MRWSTRHLIRRQTESSVREATRVAAIQRNPRSILENVLSRDHICMQVSRELLRNPEGGLEAAIKVIADRNGIPPEIVRECRTINTLETGQ